MTYLAWIFLVCWVLSTAAWMLVTRNRDDLKSANDNLIRANAKLRERATKAEHAVKRLMDARPEFRTPGFVDPPRLDLPVALTQAEHIADAIERVEYGPVLAEKRGISLPGAEVVPLRPKGGAS